MAKKQNATGKHAAQSEEMRQNFVDQRREMMSTPKGKRVNVVRSESISDDEAVELGLLERDNGLNVAAFEEWIDQTEPDISLEGENTVKTAMHASDGDPDRLTPGIDPDDLPTDRLGRKKEKGTQETADKIEAALKAEEGDGADSDSDADADHDDDDDAEPASNKKQDKAEDKGEPVAPAEFAKAHADQTVRVKIDGEAVDVPLREALMGYQRQAAFTKKTTELASERQAVRSERASLAQDGQQLAAVLTGMVQVAQQRFSPQEQAALGQIVQQLANGAATAEQRNGADQAKDLAETLKNEDAALAEALGWTAETDRDAEKRRLAEGAIEFGFTPEELASVQDHRVLVVLHDALKYRAGKSRVKNAEKGKGRDRKVTLKPGQADRRAMSGNQRSKARIQKAGDKLARTGRITDAAAAFAEMLAAEGG